MKVLVVVPDGLSRVENIVKPSHVFRGTLLGVANRATEADLILIPPANKFGFEIYEQDAGEKFLLSMNENLKVLKVPTKKSGYIDTLGNAKLLRLFFEKKLKGFDLKVTLFCYKLHAKRSKLAFESEGFFIDELVETEAEKKAKNEKLPLRLFYYQYVSLHRAYEFGALFYQRALCKL